MEGIENNVSNPPGPCFLTPQGVKRKKDSLCQHAFARTAGFGEGIHRRLARSQLNIVGWELSSRKEWFGRGWRDLVAKVRPLSPPGCATPISANPRRRRTEGLTGQKERRRQARWPTVMQLQTNANAVLAGEGATRDTRWQARGPEAGAWGHAGVPATIRRYAA